MFESNVVLTDERARVIRKRLAVAGRWDGATDAVPGGGVAPGGTLRSGEPRSPSASPSSGPQSASRCVCLHPGFTRTPVVQERLSSGSAPETAVLRDTPLGCLLEPEEIAEAIFVVAQPGMSAVTGAHLRVDGGLGALGGF
jgi:Enoyl-(Acyl carrier protein) reductase